MFLKLADFICFNFFSLEKGTKFTESFHFFIYDIIKILAIAFIMIFFIGMLRFFIRDKMEEYIKKVPSYIAYPLAVLIGTITPFCSCSSISLFIGFVQASVPFGICMAFIIASPMISEVLVPILVSSFGMNVAILYVVFGWIIAIIGGVLANKLGLANFLESFDNTTKKTKKDLIIGDSIINAIQFGYHEAVEIIDKIWVYIIIGVGIGAGLHGYIPAEIVAKYASMNKFLEVPIAVAFGIPLYANAVGIIPILEVLVNKGLDVGTVMAFTIATIALSVPEMILLRRVLKPKVIGFLVIYLFIAITLVGYVFNWLF